MLLMCQLSAHLYAEGPPLYWSQFDRKTHTIVPIQHVDVSTVSLSVCRRCTFEMLPLCFRREESIQIDMSTFPNAVDVSTVSSFVCRRSTFVLLPVCFIPHFYFLAISQNCHSTQNYEIILKMRPFSEILKKIEGNKVPLFFSLKQH